MTKFVLKRRLKTDTLRRRLAKYDPDTMCQCSVKVVGDVMGLFGVCSVGEIKSYLKSRRGRYLGRLDLTVRAKT